MCVKLPASQQLVGTVTLAFDQPRTPALPLQILCYLLGSGRQLNPTGRHQLCLNTVPSHALGSPLQPSVGVNSRGSRVRPRQPACLAGLDECGVSLLKI